ncbi:MAG: LytTR family DNA-binding domain-containing protein [Bacteroidales bacterium]|nr:LytTR family DNA-binding domain-containing protein [Bacteroidales bacterium]MCD8393513.1 LytTR family DNA-binding domain-containing protein [Bacteroidales bacterium]
MRYIIVDDEPLARKAIRMMAVKHPQLHLLGQFNSAEAAMSFLETNDTDLIFLDINMPGLSGMDLARRLPDNAMVIFTTAYSEFGAESYEVNAVDYLIKPLEPERFNRAVLKALDFNRLLSGHQPENTIAPTKAGADWMFITAERRHYRVRFDDILYIQGLKDYVVIQTSTNRLMTHMNLATISKNLPPERFLRVSKSYIVNLERIDSFDNNDLYITDNVIPIGASYRQKLLSTLMNSPLPDNSAPDVHNQ